ncbi:MAG: hypothetical protein ACK40A_12090, partial [Pannonibacter indicus]
SLFSVAGIRIGVGADVNVFAGFTASANMHGRIAFGADASGSFRRGLAVERLKAENLPCPLSRLK